MTFSCKGLNVCMNVLMYTTLGRALSNRLIIAFSWSLSNGSTISRLFPGCCCKGDGWRGDPIREGYENDDMAGVVLGGGLVPRAPSLGKIGNHFHAVVDALAKIKMLTVIGHFMLNRLTHFKPCV